MADLLDIAPSTAVDLVTITTGAGIDVRRLHVDDLAALAVRFPSLMMLFGGAGDGATALMGSPALAAFLAAGCGHIGDEKSEAIVASFSIEDQFKLLNAILRLTFPNGLGSVMQEVETMARLLGGATEVPKAVKTRLKQSPSPLQPSSGEDSRPPMQ